MKQRLLITGFEPFGRETINPSWEAVKRLEDAIGDWKLKKLQVPTVFGAAAEVVLQAAEAYAPDVILSVGQAGGRCAVTPEWVALNLREASMADNVGYMPQEVPVVTGGPAAYFSTLPCRRMVEAVKACDIPCALSYTAGTYVCNDLFYTLRHHYEGSATRVGFLHVPYLPGQAGGRAPSLPLSVIVQALRAAVGAL